MVTLNAHFDGKTIVPDEPLALAPNQKLRITIEPITEGVGTDAVVNPKRTLGSQPDLVVTASPDWADPLPDVDWTHNDPQERP